MDLIQLNGLLLPINNNRSPINLSSNIKLKNILIFNFLFIIISSFSIYFYYTKKIYFISKNINTISGNEYIKDSNINTKKPDISIQSFDLPVFYQLTRDRILYENQKKSLIKALTSNSFKGIWEQYDSGKNNKSSFSIGKSNKGKSKFEFEKAFEMRSRKDAIELVMKNYEGEYIDHWIKFTCYSTYKSLYQQIDLNKNLFHIGGKFLTNYEKGETFYQTYKKKRCYTIINMTFPLIIKGVNATLITGESTFIGKIATINPDKFTFLLNSTCGFKIKVTGNTINIEEENKAKEDQFKILINLSIFSSILYVIGVITVICGMWKTEMTVSALNAEHLVINSVWNLYGFISFLYLAFKEYIDFFLSFLVIGICSLIKLLIFDVWLFYMFWSIKENRSTNMCKLTILKIRFYLLLIILFFCSFMVMSTLYINYFWISFICISLWIPQIIHNIFTNNRYGFPFIYILACSLDRIIFPFYFRAYKNNFFMLKSNSSIFTFIIFMIIISIIFLLMQTFRGPRFMMSQKYQEFPFGFYKSKEELQEICKDINNEECVICLNSILSEKQMFEMEDKSKKSLNNEDDANFDNDNSNEDTNNSKISLDNSEKDNTEADINIKEDKKEGQLTKSDEDLDNNDDNNLLIKEENDTDKVKENKNGQNNEKEKDEIFNVKKNFNNDRKYIYLIRNIYIYFNTFCKTFKIFIKCNILFFYKTSSNINNKLYMLTPCKHVFHSDCLEKWLEQKKECPNCRTSFENLI